MAKENEIVLFETEDEKVRLTVPIQEDTVWLTQAQMTELFDTSKQNVSLHINNCFKEGELDKDSVVKDFLTTASDGKNYKTKTKIVSLFNSSFIHDMFGGKRCLLQKRRPLKAFD